MLVSWTMGQKSAKRRGAYWRNYGKWYMYSYELRIVIVLLVAWKVESILGLCRPKVRFREQSADVLDCLHVRTILGN